MDTPLRNVSRTLRTLEEIDKIVNRGVEDLQVGAKVETQDAGVFEKPVLRLLRIFGMAKRVGNNECGDAARFQQLVGTFDERNKQVPFLPKRLVLAAGKDLLALTLIPLRLFVGADIRWIAD